MLALIAAAVVLAIPVGLALGLAALFLPTWITDAMLVPLVGAALIGVPAYAVVGTVHALLTASRDLRREAAAADAFHRRILAQLTAARSPDAPLRSLRHRLGEPG